MKLIEMTKNYFNSAVKDTVVKNFQYTDEHRAAVAKGVYDKLTIVDMSRKFSQEWGLSEGSVKIFITRTLDGDIDLRSYYEDIQIFVKAFSKVPSQRCVFLKSMLRDITQCNNVTAKEFIKKGVERKIIFVNQHKMYSLLPDDTTEPMNKKKVTKEKINKKNKLDKLDDEIMILKNSGLSIPQVAKTIGVHRSSLSRHFKTKHNNLNMKEINEIKEYIYGGFSHQEIVDVFSKSWKMTKHEVSKLINNLLEEDAELKAFYDAPSKEWNAKVQSKDEYIAGAILKFLPQGTYMHFGGIIDMLSSTIYCSKESAEDYITNALLNKTLSLTTKGICYNHPLSRKEEKIEVKDEPKVDVEKDSFVDTDKASRKKGKFAFYSQAEIDELSLAISLMKDVNNKKEIKKVVKHHSREWKRSEGRVRAKMLELIGKGIKEEIIPTPIIETIETEKEIINTPVFEGEWEKIIVYPDHFEIILKK